MRSISAGLFKWAMIAAFSALCSLPALAQNSKGEFTIPREVHWGPQVLPAGTYVYSVEHHASEIVVLRPKTGDAGYFLMASSVSHNNAAMPDQVLVERRGEDWYVTSLVVDDLGESLLFLAPPAGGGTKLATIATK
jgi:hypothetical protein